MLSPRQKLLWFAVYSRVAIIILQAVSNILIADHDANVFISPEDPALEKGYLDHLIEILFGGLKRWDAQYFLHIAQYGYTFEKCLAFFPLFPIIVRYSAVIITKIFGNCLNFHSSLLLASAVINLVVFVKSADILHRLSLRILRSELKAYIAVMLYCVNPASIFFSAPYSESLFALMSFYAMLKCTENESLKFASVNISCSLPIGLSLVTRSNGIINIGFLLYTSFKNTLEHIVPEIICKYKMLKHKAMMPVLVLPFLTSMMALIVAVIIALLPLILVQIYNFVKYCSLSSHNLPKFLQNPDFVLPGSAASAWCNDTIPISYSYVQSHYWGVGFLTYYEIKQIPNFLLAMPILSLMTYHCCMYIKNNWQLCLRLGLQSNLFNNKYIILSRQRPYNNKISLNDSGLFVYMVHGLSLTIFCICFVHIQVSTRLLTSASPILYWSCSNILITGQTVIAGQNILKSHFHQLRVPKQYPVHHLPILNLEGVNNMHSKWRTFFILNLLTDFRARLIQYYFIGYFIIGTIFFSNFYPWT